MSTGLPATLGDVLYSHPSVVPPSEEEWLQLLQAIARGDEDALHALCERSHRIVFTLVSRLTRDPHAADALALQVYGDAWIHASRYDAEHATVLGWLMNLARSRALAPRAADRSPLLERLADRIAEHAWREPEWVGVAPGIFCQLLARDAERERISMLVRLVPGGAYPAHTHAGVEELHLLQGELWIDDRKLYPGDYNRTEAGTADTRVWTETGCACVLVTHTRDILRTPDDDIYRATMLTAARLIGGAAPLARRLQVPMADMNRWLAGHDRPSMGTFLKAVDLVIEESGKPRLR